MRSISKTEVGPELARAIVERCLGQPIVGLTPLTGGMFNAARACWPTTTATRCCPATTT
ncbi:hypothetical protein K2Z83_10155 [Oscillochloris sp. ZM17-4]|uniref:hypothetical protein n=1 Tax=Oscillochloris sp. ZM17-4 TaxID=2866714 RepID=UPI001C735403|nr:hypothetical protein [Oscillochloris sp. ZM17-4]MBX0328038.1 hypothetical protein [Oscillochloris sp. ZM17-4]